MASLDESFDLKGCPMDVEMPCNLHPDTTLRDEAFDFKTEYQKVARNARKATNNLERKSADDSKTVPVSRREALLNKFIAAYGFDDDKDHSHEYDTERGSFRSTDGAYSDRERKCHPSQIQSRFLNYVKTQVNKTKDKRIWYHPSDLFPPGDTSNIGKHRHMLRSAVVLDPECQLHRLWSTTLHNLFRCPDCHQDMKKVGWDGRPLQVEGLATHCYLLR